MEQAINRWKSVTAFSTQFMLASIPGYIYTVGVSLLIAFIAFTSQVIVIVPFLGGWTLHSCLTILGPLNVILVLIYYNYYLAVTTDPGRIPIDWVSSKGKSIVEEQVNDLMAKEPTKYVAGA